MSKEDEENSVRADLVAAFGGTESDFEATDLLDDEKQAAPPPELNDDKAGDLPDDDAANKGQASEGEEGKRAAESDDKKSSGEKPVDPPVRWTKEEKETFAALEKLVGPEHADMARRAQEILVSRNKSLEGAFTKRMQEIAAEREQNEQRWRSYGALEEMLAPRREQWAMQGLDEARAVQQLFALSDYAAAKPADFLRWFAQQRGITPEQLGFEQPEPVERQIVQVIDQQGNIIDSYERQGEQKSAPKEPQRQGRGAGSPELPPQLLSELQNLRQQVNYLGSHHQQILEQQHRQYSQAGAQTVEQFAAATDDAGNALYPFFSEVRADMASYMQANPNLTLEGAYSAAVAARPDLHEAQRENERLRWQREQEASARAEAAKARRAGSSLPATGSSTSGGLADGGAEGLSLRETLQAAWRNAEGGSRV